MDRMGHKPEEGSDHMIQKSTHSIDDPKFEQLDGIQSKGKLSPNKASRSKQYDGTRPGDGHMGA